MSASQRIAFIGLGDFERHTLESFFRLDHGPHHYDCVDSPDDADWLVADADRPAAVLRVLRLDRLADTLFVGAGAVPSRRGAQLPRPIDAHRLRRRLDELSDFHETRPARPGADLRLPAGSHQARAAALADHQVQDFHSSSSFSNTVLSENDWRLERILVVSSSPAESRLLRDTLSALGYRVHFTRSAEKAEQMTQQIDYGFVFLGVGQGGSHGFQACRHLHRHVREGERRPTVIALATEGSAIERIRATFAGCDAFLSAPFDEHELLHLLARHDRTFERVFQPTGLLPPADEPPASWAP
jgi:CheY-like chemotaxis protein